MMTDRTSVLLLDDTPALLSLYQKELARHPSMVVTAETDGHRAYALASTQLFDAVLIDAKLLYRGNHIGGLQLADDLSERYGSNALLIISQYITENMLVDRGEHFGFMEKYPGDRIKPFIAALKKRIFEMRASQYVFVAMPFRPECNQLYRRQIKPGIEKAGFRCVRVDEVQHNRYIPTVIFDLVRRSKAMVFLADGGNPNAYYEAGFADALNKEIIFVARSFSELTFDIAGRHAIAYGKNVEGLALQLCRKLRSLRLDPPVGR